MGEWKPFNVNDKVRVRLTETGLERLRAIHEKYQSLTEALGDFKAPAVDEDGFSEIQLWSLMQDFGPVITLGGKVPFETTIYLPPPPGSERPTAPDVANLIADLAKFDWEISCEGCGAPLLDGDDYLTGEDCSGCWATMTDTPSSRERPCYAYRVGKPSAARAALTAHNEQGEG